MILREMPSVSDIRDADAVRRFTLLPGSLAWRSFLINAGVVIASCAALIISPATVSDPIVPSELAILAAGVVVCLAVNLVLVRRTFAPLEVSAPTTRTREASTPKASAAMPANVVSTPVMSAAPVMMVRRPSESIRHTAAAGS